MGLFFSLGITKNVTAVNAAQEQNAPLRSDPPPLVNAFLRKDDRVKTYVNAIVIVREIATGNVNVIETGNVKCEAAMNEKPRLTDLLVIRTKIKSPQLEITSH